MKLHEEFKLFETLWDDLVSAYPELEDEAPNSSTIVSPNSPQGKAKEIMAEIARLKQELSSLNLEDITTSSIFAEVPGTTKKFECRGVSSKEAVDALVNFINSLSSKEEKQAVVFHWCNDSWEKGDGEGDPILSTADELDDDGFVDFIDNTHLAHDPIPKDAEARIFGAMYVV